MSTLIDLKDYPTTPPDGWDFEDYKKDFEDLQEKIGDLQHLLYAESNQGLLIILQGMDASGKDGTSRAVFARCSPNGINAVSFKKPTEEEMGHDFLWRVNRHAPEKGYMQIFNRSHYEDVLIQRVHKWVTEERIEQRYAAINAWEKIIHFDANTTILKFYMHISRERQLEKLKERVENPKKQWKHNDNDWKEKEHWDTYRKYYNDMLNRSYFPWIIVPADHTPYRNYFVAKTIRDTLLKMDPQRPSIDTTLFL